MITSPMPGKFQFDNAEERFKTFYALKARRDKKEHQRLSLKRDTILPSIDLKTAKSTYSKFEILNNLKRYR